MTKPIALAGQAHEHGRPQLSRRARGRRRRHRPGPSPCASVNGLAPGGRGYRVPQALSEEREPAGVEQVWCVPLERARFMRQQEKPSVELTQFGPGLSCPPSALRQSKLKTKQNKHIKLKQKQKPKQANKHKSF